MRETKTSWWFDQRHLPSRLRSKSDGEVGDAEPDEGFVERQRQPQQVRGQNKRPRRIKQQIPLLIKNRQPLDSQRHLRKTIKHHVDEREEKSTEIETPVDNTVGLQGGPKKHRHRDQRHDTRLHRFEDVDRLVALHQHLLPVQARLEELPGCESVPVSHQRRGVTRGPVEGCGKFFHKLLSDVKLGIRFGEFAD